MEMEMESSGFAGQKTPPSDPPIDALINITDPPDPPPPPTYKVTADSPLQIIANYQITMTQDPRAILQKVSSPRFLPTWMVPLARQ